MSDDNEYEDREYEHDQEPHQEEADDLIDSYDGASIDVWSSRDLARLVELLDIELQNRAPSISYVIPLLPESWQDGDLE